MNNLLSLDYDFDLFAKCKDLMLHFATAGGFVPAEIVLNPIHNKIRTSLLNSDVEFKYNINPAIDEIFNVKFEAQGINSDVFDRELYLRDFIIYARKGCFSFDRTYISDHYSDIYHLVAYPVFDKDNCPPSINNNFIDKIVKEYLNKPNERVFLETVYCNYYDFIMF